MKFKDAVENWRRDNLSKPEYIHWCLHDQPDRSKREDSIISYVKHTPRVIEVMKKHLELFEMRYSEHCGNTVREVQ